MFRGRYALGEEIPLHVLCVDAAGTPVTPDYPPNLKVWNTAGTKVVNKLVPHVDPGGQTGLFGMRVFLGADFAVGYYTATWSWSDTSGAHAGVEFSTFEIVAGGNSNGAVVAITHHHTPAANYVVKQLTRGAISKGRTPRLT